MDAIEDAQLEMDKTARIISDFMLVPPDGGDLKLHEGAQQMRDALVSAEAERDAAIARAQTAEAAERRLYAEHKAARDHIAVEIGNLALECDELRTHNKAMRETLLRIVALTDVSATNETLEGRAILAITSEALNALAN